LNAIESIADTLLSTEIKAAITDVHKTTDICAENNRDIFGGCVFVLSSKFLRLSCGFQPDLKVQHGQTHGL
jgi:hypothetical protein